MNLDRFRRRPLNIEQGYKPLDVGMGGLNASISRLGRLLAVNNYHEKQGYMTLTSAAPFPEHERYNPAAVRAYRRSLVEMSSPFDRIIPPGFGLSFQQYIHHSDNYPIERQEFFLLEDVIPCVRLTFEYNLAVEIIAFVPQIESSILIHYHKVKSKKSPGRILMGWSGLLSLQRCAYTQLTEGGVIPIPALHSEMKHDAHHLSLANDALKAQVNIYGDFPVIPVLPDNPDLATYVDPVEDIDESVLDDGRRMFTAEGAFFPNDVHSYSIEFGRYPKQQVGVIQPEYAEIELEKVLEYWQQVWKNVPDDLILRRALNYGLACCIPTSEEAICIITDHMLLPLSWNRDAYYVVRMLLSWREEMRNQVRGHLIWMFEVAERVEGFWGRSYLANGRVKDRSFQLDQQLFPLLELTEYVLETGEQTLLERFQSSIAALMAGLMQRKATFAPMLPTDETPADDPMTLPYHLSSHILWWFTLQKMAQAKIEGDWLTLASEVKAAVEQYFTADFQGQKLYAYATDGQGSYRFYHDANDFPLALAPLWGFCAVDDPVWRATINFAFSEANEGGFYAGRLGSVHTPAPWALGDVQDLIIAQLLGDAAREQKARDHLQFAAQWDGALPEAYDAETGAVISRHWFAWPNAAYACVELGAFKPKE